MSNPALEGFTLPKVLWLRDHEPEAFARLAKVLLAKDYIRYRLTGELATEPSDASGTLMFDVAHRRWSGEMLARGGAATPSLLPDVGGSSEVLGRVTRARRRADRAWRPGTPVVGGGADNACGAVGVGAVAPGEAVASWGTSGTVLAPDGAARGRPADARAHLLSRGARHLVRDGRDAVRRRRVRVAPARAGARARARQGRGADS